MILGVSIGVSRTDFGGFSLFFKSEVRDSSNAAMEQGLRLSRCFKIFHFLGTFVRPLFA